MGTDMVLLIALRQHTCFIVCIFIHETIALGVAYSICGSQNRGSTPYRSTSLTWQECLGLGNTYTVPMEPITLRPVGEGTDS